MTAYVDDAGILWKGKKRFHLCADTVEELHAFAASIGVRPCWFHRGAKVPHYDVTADQREAALQAGAQAVDQRTQVRLARARATQATGENQSLEGT